DPDQLLTYDVGLQGSLVPHGHVLEVAATTGLRTGETAGRLDPLLRRLKDLDSVSTPEAVAVVALGDLDDHALSRQRVPGEDHAGGAGISGVCCDPRDAVSAVGDRTDHSLKALAH